MCKTLKAALLSVYVAFFLHSINYLLFYEKYDIVEINYLLRVPGKTKKMLRELRKFKNNSTVMTLDFKKLKRFPSDLKFILHWSHEPAYHRTGFTNGQTPFILNNCSHVNCHLTADRTLLPDVRYYDAILFDVESEWDEHPLLRADHQTYVFTTSESAKTYPLCNQKYDDYYNLTWTYKLNSNIIKSTFKIMDRNGNIVGPKLDVSWISQMLPTSDDVKLKLRGKNLAAALFISNCDMKNNIIIANLNDALTKNKLTLDTYGWCGKLRCPKSRIEECLLLLRKKYYFYFAVERTISVDYVTEELLYPLLNYAVPVVYGGANYSRFLPPGSYIDASISSSNEVASRIQNAIKNPNTYHDYFRWHNHYTYKEVPQDDGICELCRILNNPSKPKIITNIRSWWNPNYKELCS